MSRTTTQNELFAAALSYASLGWRVVPLADRDKMPRIKDWPNMASTDQKQIREWWAKWPAANVGIALGLLSGLVGVDIDSDAGEQLLHMMAGDDLPDTCEMVTGKGRRLMYAIPAGLTPRTEVLTVPGGELRFQSDGGQCVMPPSIHPGDEAKGIPPGRIYQWVEGRSPADLQPTPMPGWLVAEMCRPKQADFVDAAAPSAFAPGADYNRRGSWGELLTKHGFRESGQRESVTYYTRPGKARGVSVTVGHYKATDGTPALFVFTSSVLGLPANKCLDLFGAYARLEHGGDYSRAAGALAGLGYGAPRARPTMGGKAAPVGAPPAEPEPWGEPIPLRSETPSPDFPLKGFPASIREFMLSVSAQVNVPVGYVGANILGVAAGAIGATATLRLTPEWIERACLFVAVVAPKTSGKTPTHMAAMKPLRREQAERLKAGEKSVFFTTDTTVEAIAPILRDRPRGLMVAADELSGFVGGMNQYKAGGKGADRQFWLSCWSGTPISVLRRNPEAPHLYVAHPCVSVLGGVQPAVLETAFGTDDGFAERFLFEASDPLPPARVTRGEYRYADIWGETISRLAKLEMVKDNLGTRPAVLTCSEEAWEVFADWSVTSAGGEDRDQALDGFRGKARAYAARLALVLHLLNHEGGGLPPLSGRTMADGVLLARYYLDQVTRVRAGVLGGVTDVDRVQAWIAKSGKSQLTRRDAFRGLRKSFPEIDQLSAPLKKLVQHGWLRYAPDPTGPGRRAEATYEVHPQFGQLCHLRHPSVTRPGDESTPYAARGY